MSKIMGWGSRECLSSEQCNWAGARWLILLNKLEHLHSYTIDVLSKDDAQFGMKLSLVLLDLLAIQDRCIVTTVTDTGSFVERIALTVYMLLYGLTLFSHRRKIPRVNGLIRYTVKIPLPSHLLKDKIISLSKRNTFCSEIKLVPMKSCKM